MPETIIDAGHLTNSRKLTSLLFGWLVNHRTRSDLKGLDQERLRDLGLSDQDVAEEVRKWFWQS